PVQAEPYRRPKLHAAQDDERRHLALDRALDVADARDGGAERIGGAFVLSVHGVPVLRGQHTPSRSFEDVSLVAGRFGLEDELPIVLVSGTADEPRREPLAELDA